ncbi:MAG: glycine oxidase ThiO [Acidobacteriota bacterium]
METPETCDVLIVGGGIIGLSLAYELSQQKLKIAVLERARCGSEASSAGAGILAPQAEMDAMNPLTRLCVESRELYSDFVAELADRSRRPIEYRQTGLLYLALSDQANERLQERFNWQKEAGFTVERLDPKEVLELEPFVNPELRSALYFSRESVINNVEVMEALEVVVRASGVQVLTECEVSSVESQPEGDLLVCSVQGEWKTDRVVIAAGCWSGQIRSPLSYSVPVRPVRGQIVETRTESEAIRHVIYSDHSYLVPRQDHTVLLGSTTEWVGYSKGSTLEGVRRVIENSLRMVPSLDNCPVIRCRAGLRPHCEDGLPVIGATQTKGLYFASGHFRNGLLLAPITARLMAKLLIDGETNELLGPFSPERFSTACQKEA